MTAHSANSEEVIPDSLGWQSRVEGPRHAADVLSGCRIVDRGYGWAVAEMQLAQMPSEDAIPLGWLGTVADAATAQALAEAVAPGQAVKTVSLRLDAAEAVPAGAEIITARGKMVGLDEHSGVSRATLRRSDGTKIAVCTARFVVVPQARNPDASAYLKPTVICSDGAKPLSMAQAFGAVASELSNGRSVWTAVPSSKLGNHHGMVHGGFHVGMIDLASRSAARSLLERRAPALLDLSLVYHRPIPATDESFLVLSGNVVRQGKRIVVVTGTIESDTGKLLTSSTATFLA